VPVFWLCGVAVIVWAVPVAGVDVGVGVEVSSPPQDARNATNATTNAKASAGLIARPV
jgi:hypothetical protein